MVDVLINLYALLWSRGEDGQRWRALNGHLYDRLGQGMKVNGHCIYILIAHANRLLTLVTLNMC